MSNKEERSYIMIKPDGVQRGLIGRIIARFEDKGFKLIGLKLVQAQEEVLNEHYEELKVFLPFIAIMGRISLTIFFSLLHLTFQKSVLTRN